MRINKQKNEIAVLNFLNNKYIKSHDIKESIFWIDEKDHKKGTEDVYVYGTIDLEVSNVKDLDIFMKDFLKSPLRHLDIKINHQIKSLHTTKDYIIARVTDESLDKNNVILKNVNYKILYS